MSFQIVVAREKVFTEASVSPALAGPDACVFAVLKTWW